MNNSTNESGWYELEGGTADVTANGIDSAGATQRFKDWADGILPDQLDTIDKANTYPVFTYATPDNDVVSIFLDWRARYTPSQTAWERGTFTLLPLDSPELVEDILESVCARGRLRGKVRGFGPRPLDCRRRPRAARTLAWALGFDL